MSFLAPLYLLGGLGIVAPILWHLVRRRPKTQMPFSSLMFLQPSPPKVARRSRLENLPLLLLRVLALLLLALAFARPLFRGASETASVPEGRRVVVLVDTSASMKRDGLWEAAQKKTREIVAGLESDDSVSLLTFDTQPKVVWSFDESVRVSKENRMAQVDAVLKSLSPTWFASDLGAAISFAGDYARQQNDLPSTEHPDASAAIPTAVFVVSDMQSGSDISSLQSYTWPDDSQLEVHRVETAVRTNASLVVLGKASASESAESSERGIRVRVANTASSSNSTFSLTWSSLGNAQANANLSTQVPPGESRVVRMPEPATETRSLRLVGDDHGFDNEWFIVPPSPRKSTVVYLGKTIEAQRESLFYYAKKLPLSSRNHEITLERRDVDSLVESLDPETVPLVIVGEPVPADRVKQITDYVERGGRVLWVLDDAKSVTESAASLQQLTGVASLEITEATVADYALFSKIDFKHELFLPLADPRFNDFSKIRTWSYRRVAGYPESWKPLVSFDSGDAALVEVTMGDGRLWLMTMGWQPQSSQLALSTKFIPIVVGMVRSRDARRNDQTEYFAGDPVPEDLLPNVATSTSDAEWMTVDGRFASPGVYRSGDREFAVNVMPSESETDPLPIESLERLGVTVGVLESRAQTASRERHIQDAELERRQGLWQWALASVLGLIGIETLVSGFKSRRQLG